MFRPLDVLREPPFSVVTQHMTIIVQTVERLRPLFEALDAGDQTAVERLCAEITALEEAADQIKNAVRDHLPKDIHLPVSRRDLLTVVSAQDTISDNCLNIVWLLEVRRFTVPEQIAEPLMKLIDMVTDAAREGRQLLGQVEVMAEAGFSEARIRDAAGLIGNIEAREAECDRQAHRALRALFDAEAQIGPVSTILWDRIIELVGSLADSTKKLANRVRLLIAQ